LRKLSRYQAKNRYQRWKNKKPNPQWQADIDWPVVHDLPPKVALPLQQGFSCFDQFAL
jgi:hypothetical protein